MSRPHQVMFDVDARVERMIWIPGIGNGNFSEDFAEEFCDSLPLLEDDQLYQKLPKLLRFAGDYGDPETIADTILFNVPGFLIYAATPVYNYVGADKAIIESGWGHYYTEWLYAASEAEIPQVISEWAEAQHERDKAKAATPTEATAEDTAP